MKKHIIITTIFSFIVLFTLKHINNKEYITHSNNLIKDLPIIYILFIGPIFEELLFRGYILTFLENKTKYANFIQASIFSLIHINPLQIIYTFIFSLYLGNLKRKYGIYFCIFLHILFNFIGYYK